MARGPSFRPTPAAWAPIAAWVVLALVLVALTLLIGAP